MRQLSLFHRWLGLLAALALLLFGLSGLLHIALSRLQPQPAAFIAPPAPVAADATALGAAMQRLNLTEITGARSVAIAGDTYYRLQTTDAAYYLAARSGTVLEAGERRHAESLARHFSGDAEAAILRTTQITAFDNDYLPVNRLLPVWRVDLARPDGLTLFIDTKGDRLATLVDDRKRVLQGLFLQLHTFAWADGLPWLRLPLILALLAATGAAAAVGIALWWRRRRLPVPPLRRWHRRIGLGVAITTFAFVISGGWRLLHAAPADAPIASVAAPRFTAAMLAQVPAGAGFILLDSPLGPCYLQRALSVQQRASVQQKPVKKPAPRQAAPSRGGAHHHHGDHHGDCAEANAKPMASSCISTESGQPLPDAEQALAVRLAQRYAGSDAPATAVSRQQRFGGEYGFINKRLPVWRVELADHPARWYVEPASGALALEASDTDAVAAAIFSNLHKWQFFGADRTGLRDTLQVLFVGGNIGVGLAGVVLFWRRPGRRLHQPRRV